MQLLLDSEQYSITNQILVILLLHHQFNSNQPWYSQTKPVWSLVLPHRFPLRASGSDVLYETQVTVDSLQATVGHRIHAVRNSSHGIAIATDVVGERDSAEGHDIHDLTMAGSSVLECLHRPGKYAWLDLDLAPPLCSACRRLYPSPIGLCREHILLYLLCIFGSYQSQLFHAANNLIKWKTQGPSLHFDSRC